jgi:alkylmercury lyase
MSTADAISYGPRCERSSSARRLDGEADGDVLPHSGLTEPAEVRRAAFRWLLANGRAASAQDLATGLRCSAEELLAAVESLAAAGSLRIDEDGRVFGSAGLSVVPDRHRIEIDGRTFWTWCAYDAVGILGALEASGRALSRSPLTGAPIEVQFRAGRARPAGVVLFRPDDSYRERCANLYEQWCPNSNFFESRDTASAWMAENRLDGRVLSLDEATDLAGSQWRPLLPAS